MKIYIVVITRDSGVKYVGCSWECGACEDVRQQVYMSRDEAEMALRVNYLQADETAAIHEFEV